MAEAISFAQVPAESTKWVNLEGSDVGVTSPPAGESLIEITDIIGNLDDFHGSHQVHDVVNFGRAFAGLIGKFRDPANFYQDRANLPEKGVIILADHYSDAALVVSAIDKLARRVIDDSSLYADVGFCQDYFDAAENGYDLMAKYLPRFDTGRAEGLPISLVRAGMVTTRLALGLDKNAVIDDEVRVVTKRFHAKGETDTELMVSVKWEDLDDIKKLGGNVMMADFVNPASGASALAWLLSAHARGVLPKTLIHKSIMATEQGIAFSRQLMESGALGDKIDSLFYTLGTSNTLSGNYYLENPAVADAGHVLRHFLPDWYKQ